MLGCRTAGLLVAFAFVLWTVHSAPAPRGAEHGITEDREGVFLERHDTGDVRALTAAGDEEGVEHGSEDVAVDAAHQFARQASLRRSRRGQGLKRHARKPVLRREEGEGNSPFAAYDERDQSAGDTVDQEGRYHHPTASTLTAAAPEVAETDSLDRTSDLTAADGVTDSHSYDQTGYVSSHEGTLEGTEAYVGNEEPVAISVSHDGVDRQASEGNEAVPEPGTTASGSYVPAGASHSSSVSSYVSAGAANQAVGTYAESDVTGSVSSDGSYPGAEVATDNSVYDSETGGEYTYEASADDGEAPIAADQTAVIDGTAPISADGSYIPSDIADAGAEGSYTVRDTVGNEVAYSPDEVAPVTSSSLHRSEDAASTASTGSQIYHGTARDTSGYVREEHMTSPAMEDPYAAEGTTSVAVEDPYAPKGTTSVAVEDPYAAEGTTSVAVADPYAAEGTTSVAVEDPYAAEGTTSVAVEDPYAAEGTTSAAVEDPYAADGTPSAGIGGSHAGEGATSTGIGGSYAGEGATSRGIGDSYAGEGATSTGIGGSYAREGATSTGIGDSYAGEGATSTGIGGSYAGEGATSTGIGGSYAAEGATSADVGSSYTTEGAASTGIGGSYAAEGATSTGVGGSYAAEGTTSAAIGSSYAAEGTTSTAIDSSYGAEDTTSAAIGNSYTAEEASSVPVTGVQSGEYEGHFEHRPAVGEEVSAATVYGAVEHGSSGLGSRHHDTAAGHDGYEVVAVHLDGDGDGETSSSSEAVDGTERSDPYESGSTYESGNAEEDDLRVDGIMSHDIAVDSSSTAGEELDLSEPLDSLDSLDVPMLSKVKPSSEVGRLSVTGFGFRETTTLVCRHAARNEVTLAKTSVAQYVNSEFVLCELPSDLRDYPEEFEFDLEVSNDGKQFSEPLMYSRAMIESSFPPLFRRAGRGAEPLMSGSPDAARSVGIARWRNHILFMLVLSGTGALMVRSFGFFRSRPTIPRGKLAGSIIR